MSPKQPSPHRRKPRFEPGLPPRLRWPSLLQTVLVLFSWDRLRRYCERRFGSIYMVKPIGFGNVVVVNRPEEIAQVLTGDHDVLLAGESNARLLTSIDAPHSVAALDGADHLRARRLLSPALHGDSLQGYAELIRGATNADIDHWPVGEPFPLLPRMRAIGLKVILDTVIGVKDERRAQQFNFLLPQLLGASLYTLAAIGAYPKFASSWVGRRLPWVRVRDEVDRLIYEELSAHRADPLKRDDILSLLIRTPDSTGHYPTDRELRDHLLTLLLAGYDTTATATTWCIERLLRHPEVMAKLRDELQEQDSAYLDAVIYETLRVRPLFDFVARKLSSPFELAGFRLPAGTTIAPSISGVHRSEVYGDPQEFRPERHLGEKLTPYALIPFGGGPRRCIGASFALLEMRTILRVILERTTLVAPMGRPERPTHSRHTNKVPSRGGRVLVTEKRSPR